MEENAPDIIIVATGDVLVAVLDVPVYGAGALRISGLRGAQHMQCGMDTQGNDKASGWYLDGEISSVALSHDYN